MGWILYLFVVAAGSFSAVQAGANAQLRKSLDQPLLAALCVYGSAFVALLIALPFTRLSGFSQSKAAEVPWWAWLGGLLSIMSTMAGLMLAKKMGSMLNVVSRNRIPACGRRSRPDLPLGILQPTPSGRAEAAGY
jgi:transporter family-2 protein